MQCHNDSKIYTDTLNTGFRGGSDYKESSCSAGDLGSVPGSGRSAGGGHGNPLQYFCLKNPMDRGAWQDMVHRVARSWTQLKRLSMHTCPQLFSSLLNLMSDKLKASLIT